MLWLGSFHQSGSAWDLGHYDSRYLQTAITRPAIENWEDEEGLMPQHIAGAPVDSRRPLGSESGLQIDGGIGASPSVASETSSPQWALQETPERWRRRACRERRGISKAGTATAGRFDKSGRLGDTTAGAHGLTQSTGGRLAQ